MAFFETISQALPAITAGVVLAVLGWGVPKLGRLFKFFSEFKSEHESLVELEGNADDIHAELEKKIEQVREDTAKQVEELLKQITAENKEYQRQIELQIEELKKYQKTFNDSQRTQIKWQIVDIYQQANAQKYITPLELDVVNKLFENYVELNGNTYVDAIVQKCNKTLPIQGEAIPESH